MAPKFSLTANDIWSPHVIPFLISVAIDELDSSVEGMGHRRGRPVAQRVRGWASTGRSTAGGRPQARGSTATMEREREREREEESSAAGEKHRRGGPPLGEGEAQVRVMSGTSTWG